MTTSISQIPKSSIAVELTDVNAKTVMIKDAHLLTKNNYWHKIIVSILFSFCCLDLHLFLWLSFVFLVSVCFFDYLLFSWFSFDFLISICSLDFHLFFISSFICFLYYKFVTWFTICIECLNGRKFSSYYSSRFTMHKTWKEITFWER